MLAKNRWQLKKAVRIIKQIVSKLKLSLHSEKKFIGRISRGFDFLGYFFKSNCKLRPSEKSIQKFKEHVRRLYEQGENYNHLLLYIQRWICYIHGGLKGLVSRKGGLKRYIVMALKFIDINNMRI